MANAWDIVDSVLQQQLEKWRAFILTEDAYNIHLYQNDYTPIPGSAIGDYTEATFPGYASNPINNANWGSVTVAAHVASMTHDDAASFVAADSGFVSQIIYGYYITDSLGAYLWGERFELSKTVEPEDTLNVTPIMRHGVLPAP